MRSVLNEDSFLSTFTQILKSVESEKSSKNKDSFYLGGSISKYTKNLIMSFPVLCDDTLNIETSQWISKACEKNIASMMEMIFSSISINTKNSNAAGAEIIRKFHKNIDSMSLDDAIEYTNDFLTAHENAYTPKISQSQINDAIRECVYQLKTPQKRFGENFSEKSINEYLCRTDYRGNTVVFEAPARYLEKQNAFLEENRMKEAKLLALEEASINEEISLGTITEAPEGWYFDELSKQWRDPKLTNEYRYKLFKEGIDNNDFYDWYPGDKDTDANDRARVYYDPLYDDHANYTDNDLKSIYQRRHDERREMLDQIEKERRHRYQNYRDDIADQRYKKEKEEELRRYNDKIEAEKRRDEIEKLKNKSQNRKDIQDLQFRRVKDSDFKKANELQPTLMVINFNVLEGDNVVDRKSFVAGIKCRLIAAGATDIMERLASVNKTQLSFKNLIRATTGEIKFGRDFILAINQQKFDSKNDVKKGEAAKIWATLKKRSTKNIFRKLSRDKNDASAITTLVVSQDTVNYIKSTTGFDVGTPKGANQVMDAYNLLCFVIADETNEVAKFLYDGSSNFETLAFTVLAKEAMDKQYKKIVNVIK